MAKRRTPATRLPAHETVDPSTLLPHERNSKRHPEQQLAMLGESIKRFGFLAPIVLGANNVVLAGHARLTVAKRLGLATVPVVRAEHLTPEEQRAYVIADNRLAELANWDADMLRDEVSVLLASSDGGYDLLAAAGFTEDDVDTLLAQEEEPDGDADSGDGDGSGGGELERLRFGDVSVPMTENELARLEEAHRMHVRATGSSFGFVASILDAAQ